MYDVFAMTAFTTSCPGCGAPVRFEIASSLVVVCSYCHSVVARTDQRIEDLGKIAQVMETQSPLKLGLRGSYQGLGFVLTGRSQIKHPAGGFWDEWYGAFDNGSWGWIAEAQGRFFLSYQIPLPPGIPAWEQLKPGLVLPQLGPLQQMVVSETNQGEYFAAEGEIPWKLKSGEVYWYADLSGPNGTFATLDYSESPPLVFVGQELNLAGLGWGSLAAVQREKKVKGSQLSCPHCGGALQLKAPDQTQRVGCPYCGSLLSAEEGELKYLTTLQKTQKLVLPLGAQATFEGHMLQVLGAMIRSTRSEGETYYWQEFLLYHPQLGFRWLVYSDQHWSYVVPVAAGDVRRVSDRAVQFKNETFKLYNVLEARVDYVEGEFYWKVEAGETVRGADFICPPKMLSQEMNDQEVSWSLGTYIEKQEIESKFKLAPLPVSSLVAPHQPNPHRGMGKLWGLFTLAAFFLYVLLAILAPGRQVFFDTIQLNPVQTQESTQIFFSQPFELKGRNNLEIRGMAPVDNSWVYAEGDLINESTGLVQAFELPIEYFHGVDGGESWSEGSRKKTVYLSPLPAGRYTLRLEVQRKDFTVPSKLEVQIRQGVTHFWHFMVVTVILGIFPFFSLMARMSFEQRRWSDSPYSPYGQSE